MQSLVSPYAYAHKTQLLCTWCLMSAIQAIQAASLQLKQQPVRPAEHKSLSRVCGTHFLLVCFLICWQVTFTCNALQPSWQMRTLEQTQCSWLNTSINCLEDKPRQQHDIHAQICPTQSTHRPCNSVCRSMGGYYKHFQQKWCPKPIPRTHTLLAWHRGAKGIIYVLQAIVNILFRCVTCSRMTWWPPRGSHVTSLICQVPNFGRRPNFCKVAIL